MNRAVPIVICLLGIAAAALVFGPFGPPEHFHGTLRVAAAKQIALAEATYRADNDEHIPDFRWRPLLLPYTKNPDLFERREGKILYILAQRATLTGADASSIVDPAKKILILDVAEASDPFVAELPALAFRENNGNRLATVGFVDGHAKVFARPSLGDYQ